MDDYIKTFEARGDHYNEAARIHPRARDLERRILIDLLQIEPQHLICDAPAGGGYLADGLRPLVRRTDQIICVEPSATFAAGIDPVYIAHVAPLNRLPLPDAAADRVGSLAGLHHLADKSSFVHEAHRILKPGGQIAFADVLDGTSAARFLNGAVDRYTTTGHHGLFLHADECRALLGAAGFQSIRVVHRRYCWNFNSEEQMVRYCQSLFGMVRASYEEVRAALVESFDIRHDPDKVRLPWSLVYAAGVKPVSVRPFKRARRAAGSRAASALTSA
ncbi:MAG TPA: methyltransferase domain-containing protein [Gammaproteobacteria bacterium]|nr:methyltransferase domain-containing protein [Gammaproteobacteria bacterium]